MPLHSAQHHQNHPPKPHTSKYKRPGQRGRCLSGFRALLLQGGETPAWVHLGGGGGRPHPARRAMGSFGPQHPLVRRSQLEHRLGCPWVDPLVGVAAGRTRSRRTQEARRTRKGERARQTRACLPSCLTWLRPSAGAMLSLLNLRPRPVYRTTGLALPPRGRGVLDARRSKTPWPP